MTNKKRTIAGALAALSIFAGAAAGYQIGAQKANAAEPEVVVETNADLHAAYMRGYRTGSRDGMKASQPAEDGPGYEEGYAAGLEAGKAQGYDAGYYDGEQSVITGMTIETDGDGDSALIYYKGDIYLHGINDYPLDTDCAMEYAYPLD